MRFGDCGIPIEGSIMANSQNLDGYRRIVLLNCSSSGHYGDNSIFSDIQYSFLQHMYLKSTWYEIYHKEYLQSFWACAPFSFLPHYDWETRNDHPYNPRSIFCDSSTWFKIMLATDSP